MPAASGTRARMTTGALGADGFRPARAAGCLRAVKQDLQRLPAPPHGWPFEGYRPVGPGRSELRRAPGEGSPGPTLDGGSAQSPCARPDPESQPGPSLSTSPRFPHLRNEAPRRLTTWVLGSLLGHSGHDRDPFPNLTEACDVPKVKGNSASPPPPQPPYCSVARVGCAEPGGFPQGTPQAGTPQGLRWWVQPTPPLPPGATCGWSPASSARRNLATRVPGSRGCGALPGASAKKSGASKLQKWFIGWEG